MLHSLFSNGSININSLRLLCDRRQRQEEKLQHQNSCCGFKCYEVFHFNFCTNYSTHNFFFIFFISKKNYTTITFFIFYFAHITRTITFFIFYFAEHIHGSERFANIFYCDSTVISAFIYFNIQQIVSKQTSGYLQNIRHNLHCILLRARSLAK